MKICMAAICSVNGLLTRGDESQIRSWTSTEDQAHFNKLITTHEVIVMGRKTYEAARQLIALNPHKRRVIMSRHPEQFDGEIIEGRREFTAEPPSQLVQRLHKENVATVLVVGGGEINGAFLAAGLVDELYLTLEPLLFGTGTGLAGSQPLTTSLQLVSLKYLNSQGSLLLHYARR